MTGGDRLAHRLRGGIPALPRDTWWSRIWAPFWAIPTAFFVAAAVAGVAFPILDRRLPFLFDFVFAGGPDGARAVLGAIAGAMISVIGLVFSITMVLLQLASSQFTPRVLGAFVSSRIVQVTLGLFIASFVFSLSVMREVRGANENWQAFVPQGSVALAYLLVFASVISFLTFIHHITNMIQVSRVINRVGSTTKELAQHLFPGLRREEKLDAGPTWSPSHGEPYREIKALGGGHVVAIDYAALVEAARKHGVVVVLKRRIGSFIVEGQTIAVAWGSDNDDALDRAVNRTIRMAEERTLTQDVEFGLRQLLDIADRALSPGTNDPTTAIEVLNELHRVFRGMVGMSPPSPYISGPDGDVRVVHRPPRLENLLRQCVAEIAHYGGDSPRVMSRLRWVLEDLREAALERYVSTLDALVEEFVPPTDAPRVKEL